MSELIEINGKQYEKKDIKDAIQLIEDICLRAAKMVSEVIKKAVELINEYYDKKQVDYNWHVPLDTTRLSQVRIPNVKLPRIRNLI